MLRSLKGLYHLLVAIASAAWFRFPSRNLTVVGVTGTDGKTTTVTLIYEILKSAGYRTSMISSVHAIVGGSTYDTGFHVTTPNAFWVQKYLREAVNHNDTHMVLEVTSHGLSQHRVFGIRFAVGVITNVTREHLDWHGTFEKYLRTKLSLLAHAKVAVVNCDEAQVYNRAIASCGKKQFVTYGIRRPADVTPAVCPFTTKLPGEFNRYNCLAALAASKALGIDRKKAVRVIAAFSGIPGRMEVIARQPFTVIVDFAHTPAAIEEALRTAKQLTRGRLIHVFGSAGLRDSGKRPLLGAASARYADVIILTEEDYRTEDVNDIIDQIAKGIPRETDIRRYPVRARAISYAISIAKPGDTVILTGKGHEQSLCRGNVEYPWNDQKEVRKALARTLKHETQ